MNPYIFTAYAAGMALLVGLILIFVREKARSRAEEKMRDEHACFLLTDLIPEMRREIVEAMRESLDMIPGKLIEAKREMTKEEAEWER